MATHGMARVICPIDGKVYLANRSGKVDEDGAKTSKPGLLRCIKCGLTGHKKAL